MLLKVSVIIPVYKADQFLEKAVLSALQFDEVKEVLLIEDGSPDNSLEICNNLEKKYVKIKVLQHEDKANHGAGATRNLGLENATQDFVAFLDADDYYLSNRFDAEKLIFKETKIDGVFGALGVEFLSENGKKEFAEKFKGNQLTTVKHSAEGLDVFYGLLGLNNNFGTFFHLNTLTIRTESLRKHNLKFNEELRVHQDSDFIIKLAYHCHLKSGNITEPIAIRGVHDDNRITKIKTYSNQYNERQGLLWTSIYSWSIDKNILSEYHKHIKLKHLAFKIANSQGFSKYVRFGIIAIFNPHILKTKYRFTYLKK